MRYATTRTVTLVILASLVCASCINSRYKRHYEGKRLDREDVAVIRLVSGGGMAINNDEMEKEYRSARAASQLGVAVRPGTVSVTTRIVRVDPDRFELKYLTHDGQFMVESNLVGGDLRDFFTFNDRSFSTEIFLLAGVQVPITFTPDDLSSEDAEACQSHGEACYARAVGDRTVTVPISIWELAGCTMVLEAKKGQQYHLARRSIITDSTLVRHLKNEGLTEDELRHTYLVRAHPLVNPQAMIGRRSNEYVASCCEGPACVQLSAPRHESASQ